MSSAATMDRVREIARECESREQARNGGSREEARKRVARRVGVLPGTLYTLARDRLKRLDSTVRDRLTAYAIQDLQSEIERLSHVLELARQMGAHPAGDHISEIETHLRIARALIEEAHASPAGSLEGEAGR